jgi:methyl-accepting chemotaxis protein
VLPVTKDYVGGRFFTVQGGLFATPLFIVLVVLALGGVLLAVLLARVLGSSLVKPLETLAPRLIAIREGKLNQRMPVVSNDEMGVLAFNFNSMADSIERRDVELRTIYEISREILTSAIEVHA